MHKWAHAYVYAELASFCSCTQWKHEGCEKLKTVEVMGTWDGWLERTQLTYTCVHLRVRALACGGLCACTCAQMPPKSPRRVSAH